MSFLHLFIVNKSGGLIHHRPLSKPSPPTHPKNTIGTNEWLRIASTFHSLYAIAAEASPIRLPNQKNYAGADDGIEEIRASGMILQCFQTVTGIKFVITVAVPDPPNHNSSNTNNINEPLVSSTLRDVLKEIYVLYTECVLKDPFYELEMPIRSDLFVQGVDLLIQHKYTTILQKVVTTPPTTTTMSGSYSNTLHTTTTTPSSSKLLY